ncbi:MAG: NUDIX hydrolase [Anaerolineales bacterium]|nr:NUDIX hydrolase [Anaerolineales bacterium]
MQDTAETYAPSKYERPSVTVDVVIFSFFDSQFQVLLIKRGRWPFQGSWALPGGFVDMNETLQAAALRELEEETGVTDVYLEQLYTFGDPGRDPRTRVISVVYLAFVPAGLVKPRAGDDADDARWWSINSLPEELAFDHAEILNLACDRLIVMLERSGGIQKWIPGDMSPEELRSVLDQIRDRR